MSLPISLCIIAKNEEKNISSLFESVKNIVAEIILVDTGSSDRTKEIAESYKIKTFNYKWDDNFAEARNESLKYATQDWILVLDADEVLVNESIKELEDCISDKSITHYFIEIIDEQSKIVHHLNKLFQNNIGIKYYGRIHEFPLFDKNKHRQKITSIKIKHTGYSENAWSDGKAERNERLLRKSLGDKLEYEDRLRIETYLLLNKLELKKDITSSEQLKREIFNFNNKLQKSEIKKHFMIFEIFHNMASNFFLKENNLKDSLKITLEGLKINPFSLNLLFSLSKLYTISNDDFFNALIVLYFIKKTVSKNINEIRYYSTENYKFSLDYVNYMIISLLYEFGFYEIIPFHLQQIKSTEYENLFSNVLNIVKGKVSVISSLKQAAFQSNDAFTLFRLAREMLRLRFPPSEIMSVYNRALEEAKRNSKENIIGLIYGDIIINSVFFNINIDIGHFKNENDFYYHYCLGLRNNLLKNFDSSRKSFFRAEELLMKNYKIIVINPFFREKVGNCFSEALKSSYFKFVIDSYLNKNHS